MSQIDQRKHQHLELAKKSQLGLEQLDQRFFYEPMFGKHLKGQKEPQDFAGKTLQFPIWISSMTGGTGSAAHINKNLARAAGEFGLGLGLGSCRILLESDEFYEDFNLRSICGDSVPFYANLGIAQIEQLVEQGQESKITRLVERLSCDGLIVHINPLQEWMQPEGDLIEHPPIETLKRLLDKVELNIVVKEVGQGMGPESLEALLELPLAAVEFGAFGGTNFSYLEGLRSEKGQNHDHIRLSNIGHSASEMITLVNKIKATNPSKIQCNDLIISGGIKDFLDGYYYLESCEFNACYGQAKAFLEHATGEYETLRSFVRSQVDGLEMARQFLKIKRGQ